MALASAPVVIIAVIGVWVYWAFAGPGCEGVAFTPAKHSAVGEPPSDQQMARYFLDHQSEFGQLLDGYTETDLKNLGIVDPQKAPAYFITWQDGWFGGVHEKGYLQSEDWFPQTNAPEGSVGYRYVPIGDGWYIYEYLDP